MIDISKESQKVIAFIASVIVGIVILFLVNYYTANEYYTCNYSVEYNIHTENKVFNKKINIISTTIGPGYVVTSSYKGSNSLYVGSETVESTNQYIEIVSWNKTNCSIKKYGVFY